MNVCFLPLNIDGAGCYRAIFPAIHLQERGHTAGIPAFVIQDGAGNQVKPLPLPGLYAVPPGDWNVLFMEETIPDAEVMVFHLGTMRWMYDWAVKFKNQGRKIVLDLDDDLHRVPSYNPGKLDPAVSPDNNRKWTQKMCELADAVTVATPELGRFYGRWNANVHVLPNRLHWPMWEQLEPVYERRDWRRVRVGYMGNADFHGPDLQTIGPAVGKWLRAHPDVEFVAAGDPRLHDIFQVPEQQRVSTSKVWFRCMDLPFITSTMDVGLAPLLRNDFNEGKSCLKGMEYNACGIPVLATPTEEYERWVVDGENGFLCKHPSEFVAALDVLLGDAALRETMGRHARHAAEQASMSLHIHGWESVYAGVCDNAVPAGTSVAA